MPTLGFLSERECSIFRSPEAAREAGAAIWFDSCKSLAATMDMKTMDVVRRMLLGIEIAPSSSTPQAAELLWSAMQAFAETPPPEPFKLPPSRDFFGNRKYQDTGPWVSVEVCYRPGEDPIRDLFFSRMRAQARSIITILRESEKSSFSQDEVVELLESHGFTSKSSQGVRAIWRYYRSELVVKGFLRKVAAKIGIARTSEKFY